MNASPPKVIADRYQIGKILGRGASGVTYLAQDLEQAFPVALKLIPWDPRKPELERVFDNEAELLSRLEHPNLAKVLHFGRDRDSLFLISEFVEGSDLVREARSRDWNAVFQLMVQCAWALDYLKQQGILHRDIKPANILVGKVAQAGVADRQDRLQLKLIDFGLAAEAETPASVAGATPARQGPGGTLAYMAPEVLGGKPLDRRADLYSLGLVFFEMALGKLPFAEVANFSHYLKRLAEEAIDLSPLRGQTPPGVVEAIARMVVKDPRRRMSEPLEIVRLINRHEGETFPETAQDLDRGFKQNLLSPNKPKETSVAVAPQSGAKETPRDILRELQRLSRSGKKAEAWALAIRQLASLSKWTEPRVVEEFLATGVHLLAEQGKLPEAQEWQRRLKSHRVFKDQVPLEFYLSGIYLALRQGQRTVAEQFHRDISPQLLAAASPAKRARYENYSGLLRQGEKDFAAAAAHFERAAEFAGQAGRLDQQASFIANAAGLHVEQNRWASGYALFQEALRLASDLKNRALQSSILNNLGNLYLYFGRWSEAEQALTQSIESAREEGLRPLLAYNLYLLTVTEEGRGNHERVKDYLEQILSLAEGMEGTEAVLQAWLAKGYHQLSLQDWTAAEETAFELKARARFSGHARFVLQADWLHVKICLAKGEIADPQLPKILAELEVDAQQREAKNSLWQIQSDLGRYAQMRGVLPVALAHYRSAQSLLEELETQVPEAFRPSFYRDRKKESLLAALRELQPEPAPEPRPSAPEATRPVIPAAPTRKTEDKSMEAVHQDDIPFEKWSALNRRLLAQRHVDPLLEEILEGAMQLTGAERGFILLAETGPLRIRAARNLAPESLEQVEMRFSVSVAQEVLRQGRSQVIFDAQADERFSAAESVMELKLRSLLCVPLRAGERCLGLVYLDNRFRQGVFQAEHLPRLEAMTDQAALALEHARLHEENEAAIEELKKSKAVIERLNARLEQDLEQTTTQLHAVEEGLRRQNQELALKYTYDKIIGKSSAIHAVLKSLDKVVETEIGIYIYGESGTGKELIAQAIHFNGPRAGKPFITENCAALPENLLESELFGHVRGAFTGADRNKIGMFEAAHGGTLFLDEVGEMSPGLQAKLLRVLQEGTVRPVGSNQYRKVDVRVICASNKDLREMAKEKKFRQDLYYRLNVMRLNLPALRERREDIPLLVEHFLKAQLPDPPPKKFPRLSPEAFKILFNYDWPGNIRELQNEVSRIGVLLQGSEIGADLLSPHLQEKTAAALGSLLGKGLDPQVAELEKRAILEALGLVGGNKVKAAELLKISRRTLYLKMDQFGIDPRFGKKTPAPGKEMATE